MKWTTNSIEANFSMRPQFKLWAMTLVSTLIVALALSFGVAPSALAADSANVLSPDQAAKSSSLNATSDINAAGANSARISISKAKVAKVSAKTYKGKAIKPSPKITYNGKKLVKGTDYTLSYKSNNKVGTAKIIIKGKGNFTGKQTVSFKIKGKKGSSGTVYITNTGAKYHRGSCKWLYASKIPISKSEAIAEGYEPCKVCRP